MDLPTQTRTIAEPTEPLRFGAEIRSCGGCGTSYMPDEGACPACGPRAATPRWLEAIELAQLPEGFPTLAPIVSAEVIA